MIKPQAVHVGMGDLFVCKGPALYHCIGLGSCIGLAMMDPRAEISGCVHIMLPESFPGKPVDKIGKFADLAVEELIKQMEALGANRRMIRLAYAGGAQVFKFGDQRPNNIQVGARNIVKVEEELARLRMVGVAKDIGGTSGRTMVFDACTGEIRVKTLNHSEDVLTNLKNSTSRAA